MKRRDFVRAISGAVVAWPIAARAQPLERMRRIGVLMPGVAADLENQNRVAALQEGLHELGWIEGRNVRIDYRWGGGDADRIRSSALELVALEPDVIVAVASSIMGVLQQVTHTIPIVFVNITDPVGAGFVDSLARPGGNITGFSLFEYGLAGKWLGLLKQIAPAVTRVAVIRDSKTTGGIGQWAVIQAMAPSMGIELSLVNIRDASQIERDIAAFARLPNGGLIVTANPLATQHRELIIRLAGDHKLPAVYFERYFVTGGGLISYGPQMSTSSGVRPLTSTAYSRARSPPIFPCKTQQNMSWRSI